MRNAIAMSAFRARLTDLVQRLREFHKLANEQVQPSIIVVVEPDGAGRPSRRRHAGLFRDVGKCAITIVVIQNAAAVLSDVDVGETVAVVVADGNTLSVAAGDDTGFLRNIGESAVAIVLIEGVAQWGCRV